MKVAPILVALALLLGSLPARAGFDLPGNVFRLKQLEEAKKKASSERLPITFMMSDVDTRCGLCSKASTDVLRELSRHSVMIYIGPEDNGARNVPKILQRALRSKKSGQYIPKTVVLDTALREVIAIVPYVRNKGERLALLAKVRRKMVETTNPAEMRREAPAVSMQFVVKFGWDGQLAPMPLVKITEFLDTHGIKFKLIKSGAQKCHFRVTLEGQKREDFQKRIQNFLEAYYQVAKEVQMESKTTYWLKAR